MDQITARMVRNAIILALADGKVDETERDFINRLRQELGISTVQLRELVHEIQNSDRRLVLPTDKRQLADTLNALESAALADGDISPQERELLDDIERRLRDALPAELSDEQETHIKNRVEEIYQNFADWDESTRRAKLDEIAQMGPGATVPLLLVMESYRRPEGQADPLELKTLVAEKLGQIADPRAVYYLATLVNYGETDDEICNAKLRETAATAVARIADLNLPEGAGRVEEARRWWTNVGSQEYNTLAF